MMDDKCIFCKIIQKKLPSYSVYEDRNFLGFLDIKPLNPGNSLLIPKKHFRWVSDVPNIGDYFTIANRIGQATLPLVGADYLSFLTLGMEVPHAHIRIIPRFYDDQHRHGIDTDLFVNQSPEELALLSQKIKVKIHQ